MFFLRKTYRLLILVPLVILSYQSWAEVPNIPSLTVDAWPGEVRVEWLENPSFHYHFSWQHSTAGSTIETDKSLPLTQTHVHSPFFIGPFAKNSVIRWKITAYQQNQKRFETLGETLINQKGIAIQSAHPSSQSSTWKHFEPITLRFNGFVRKKATGHITLQPIEHTLRKKQGAEKNVFTLPIDSPYLSIHLDTLTIDPQAFYRTGIHQIGSNLDFDTHYEIVLDQSIELAVNGATMHGYRLHHFITPPINLFSHVERRIVNNAIPIQMATQDIALDRLTQNHKVHGKHELTRAGRDYQGNNIKIAIMDEGILMTSAAFQSVSWSLKMLDNAFLLPLSSLQSEFNHGTAMAEFILDYAPAVELMDFHAFAGPAHTHSHLKKAFKRAGVQPFHFAELADSLGAHILNVSLINPSVTHRLSDWRKAIYNGLVISKSLGNQSNHANKWSQQQCLDPANLLPYFYDLNTASGALVTLQAALHDGRKYISQRARADDAKSYTLTILETGKGATSQAAASFSGMLAALMDAAQQYNRTYTPQQLVSTLFDTAIDIGEPGVDPIFGHGLVDLSAAIERIESGLASVTPLYQKLSPHHKIPPFNCL